MPLRQEVSLQESQQRVTDKLMESDGLLAYHGLGRGKTLAALAAADAVGGHTVYALPASLRGNLRKEQQKYTDDDDSQEVLSYSELALGKQPTQIPNLLVLDEVQRVRNQSGSGAQALGRLAKQSDKVLLLSGTPIVNHPSDMASLLSLLTRKPISEKAFTERYIRTITRKPGLTGRLLGATAGQEYEPRNLDSLRRLLAGRVDYEPSKQPDGVDVQEQVVEVPLSPEQQKLHRSIRTKLPPGFLWKVDREFPLSRAELIKLNSFMSGLRQVGLSTLPFRADKNPYVSYQQSGKLQEAVRRLKLFLDEDKRRKAIVYSNFVGAGLTPYQAALQRIGVPHSVFHGGLSPTERERARAAYDRGDSRVLLLGPAGAEGISTKGTNLIQLLDQHWNSSRLQQAAGRGLRFDSHLGLPEELRNVMVQRFVSKAPEPSLLAKLLLGRRRERTADELLQQLAAKKESLNEPFRELLRELGSQ